MAAKCFYIKITLKGEVVEGRPELSLFSSRDQHSLPSLLRLIDAARVHRRVKSLLLTLKNPTISWADIQEIHQALERFHGAGKQSVAYLEQVDNKCFYLACGAQRLYAPPSASVGLIGLGVEILFFKNLLAYLGIEPQLFSVGKYKSAAEIFTREGMSESNRSMLEGVVSSLQGQLLDKVASQRGVSTEQVQAWIDEGPCSAQEASDKGLLDGSLYQDEVEELVQRQEPKLSQLSLRKLHLREGYLKRIATFYRPQIAYVVARGVIMTGESRRKLGRRPVVGSETLISFLRTARRRKRVRAVVLRIDSPGGSALASDLIRREIQLTNEQKPVIVSFGGVATSGGYYLATGARRILGMPATLTGSIGVIYGKFSLGKLLQKIGVRVDWLDQGRHAGYFSATRPFSQRQLQQARQQMLEFYEDLFLKKVAESRSKSVEAVRHLAEGRVWTGAQAIENGLVDKPGGISEAVALASREAGLPSEAKVRVVQFSRRRTLRDLLPLPSASSVFGDQPLALMSAEIDIR